MQQSPYAVRQTVERFVTVLRDMNIAVVADNDSNTSPQPPTAERITFVEPAVTKRTIRAMVWEQDGQVWLGYVEPAAPSRSLRDRLDRMILRAVTPY